TVIANAVAYHIDVDADGKVSGIRYKSPEHGDKTISGKIYVVAANAIETAKMLLMSRTDALPDGVANRSDQVGRNLCDHPWARATATADFKYAGSRGPLSVAGGDNIRAVDTRGDYAAYRFEVSHSVGLPTDIA